MNIDQLLHETRKRLESGNTQISEFMVSLGSHLAKTKEELILDSVLEESYLQSKDVADQIRRKTKTANKLKSLYEELEAAQEETRRKRTEMRGVEEELSSYYLEIGNAALDSYRAAPEAFGPVAEYFSDVLNIDDEIRTAEQELGRMSTENQTQTFIKRTFAKGRSAILKGSLRAKQARRTKAVVDLGRKMARSTLVEDLGNGSFNAILQSAKPLLSHLVDLEGNISLLVDKSNDRKFEIVEIEKHEHMRNPLRNLEHEIDSLSVQVESLNLTLGRIYLQEGPDLEITQPAKVIVKKIDALKASIGEYEDLIARLNAAKDVLGVAKEIRALDKRAQSLQQEIQSLEEKKRSLIQEQSNFEKIRGSEDSLTLD